MGVRFDGFEGVPLPVVVVAGTARCRLERLAALRDGDVLLLDRPLGEPFELRCDGVLLAKVTPLADEERIALKVIDLPEDPGAGRPDAARPR